MQKIYTTPALKPTVGFIGLGLMGAPMAMRLVDAGYKIHIYNRTKEKSVELVKRGALWCNSPAELSHGVDVVITMVTNDAALRSIATSIQSTLRKKCVHIDCSTVSGALIRNLGSEYENAGRYFLHSPVLGGKKQAADGSLLLFVGGNDAAFAIVEPLLQILGEKIWRFQLVEQASYTKLAMNSFIAGMVTTLAQALSFSEKAGIGGATILEILRSSKLNSESFQAKGAMMLEKNFTPSFHLENLLKDTDLFLEAARTVKSSTPIADTAKNILEEGLQHGLAHEDYSAIIKLFK